MAEGSPNNFNLARSLLRGLILFHLHFVLCFTKFVALMKSLLASKLRPHLLIFRFGQPQLLERAE